MFHRVLFFVCCTLLAACGGSPEFLGQSSSLSSSSNASSQAAVIDPCNNSGAVLWEECFNTFYGNIQGVETSGEASKSYTLSSAQNHVQWNIVSTNSDQGKVLSFSYNLPSSLGAVVIGSRTKEQAPLDLSAYKSGTLEFDLKLSNAGLALDPLTGKAILDFNMGCGEWPCSGHPYVYHLVPSEKWQHFSLPIAGFIETGLDIKNVTALLIIRTNRVNSSGDNGLSFQLDNIRLNKGTDGIDSPSPFWQENFNAQDLNGWKAYVDNASGSQWVSNPLRDFGVFLPSKVVEGARIEKSLETWLDIRQTRWTAQIRCYGDPQPVSQLQFYAVDAYGRYAYSSSKTDADIAKDPHVWSELSFNFNSLQEDQFNSQKVKRIGFQAVPALNSCEIDTLKAFKVSLDASASSALASSSQASSAASSDCTQTEGVIFDGCLNPAFGQLFAADYSPKWKEYTSVVPSNHVQWLITKDIETHEPLIDIAFTESGTQGQIMIGRPDGNPSATDLSGYKNGAIELDVKLISVGKAPTNFGNAIKLHLRSDCFWPCTLSPIAFELSASEGWQHISLPLNDSMGAGGNLSKINNPLILLPIAGLDQTGIRLQIKNIRLNRTPIRSSASSNGFSSSSMISSKSVSNSISSSSISPENSSVSSAALSSLQSSHPSASSVATGLNINCVRNPDNNVIFSDCLNNQYGYITGAEFSPQWHEYLEPAADSHVQWGLVDTGQPGHNKVLDVQFTQLGKWGQLNLVSRNPDSPTLDLSQYATGTLELDVRLLNAGSAAGLDGEVTLQARTDCIWPCAAHQTFITLNTLGQWQHVSISLAKAVASGLNIQKVSSLLVLLQSSGFDAGLHLQLDNIELKPGPLPAPPAPVYLFQEDFNQEGLSGWRLQGDAGDVSNVKLSQFFGIQFAIVTPVPMQVFRLEHTLQAPIRLAAANQASAELWCYIANPNTEIRFYMETVKGERIETTAQTLEGIAINRWWPVTLPLGEAFKAVADQDVQRLGIKFKNSDAIICSLDTLRIQ